MVSTYTIEQFHDLLKIDTYLELSNSLINDEMKKFSIEDLQALAKTYETALLVFSGALTYWGMATFGSLCLTVASGVIGFKTNNNTLKILAALFAVLTIYNGVSWLIRFGKADDASFWHERLTNIISEKQLVSSLN